MRKLSLWKVILSNIKCGFCKEKNCKVRFYPERRQIRNVGGKYYTILCFKDNNKRIENTLNKKLP